VFSVETTGCASEEFVFNSDDGLRRTTKQGSGEECITRSCMICTHHICVQSNSKSSYRGYGICARLVLDRQFPDHWIGRRGTVDWPPKSSELTPFDL
jgi:hypothetical protein